MKQPWDPETPIEEVFNKIEEAAKIPKKRNDEMSEVKKISTAYNLIHQTGELSDACRDWRNKEPDLKTWANFKLHFSCQYKDYKDELDTTTTSEYKANLTKNTTESTDLQHYINQAQDKAIQDSTNFDQLCIRHNNLMLKMEQRNNELDDLKKQLLKLENLIKCNNRSNSTKNSNMNKKITYKHYCWTHGHTQNPLHTSVTCYEPATGHKKEAMDKNKLGGSRAVMDKYIP